MKFFLNKTTLIMPLAIPFLCSVSMAQPTITDPNSASDNSIVFNNALDPNFKGGAIVTNIDGAREVNNNDLTFKSTQVVTPGFNGHRILGIKYIKDEYVLNNIDKEYSIKNNKMLVEAYNNSSSSSKDITSFLGITLIDGLVGQTRTKGEISDNHLVVKDSNFKTNNDYLMNTIRWDGITGVDASKKVFYANFSNNILEIENTTAIANRKTYASSIATVKYDFRQNTLILNPNLQPINDLDARVKINITDNVLSVKNKESNVLSAKVITPVNISLSPSDWEGSNNYPATLPHSMRGGNYSVNASGNKVILDGGNYTGTTYVAGTAIHIYSFATDNVNATRVTLNLAANNNTVVLKNSVSGLENAIIAGAFREGMYLGDFKTELEGGAVCQSDPNDKNCSIYKEDLITGNTLMLDQISNTTIGYILNFQYINFKLNRDNFMPDGDSQDAILTIANGAYYGDKVVDKDTGEEKDQRTQIKIVGIEGGGSVLEAGEKTVLLQADSMDGELVVPSDPQKVQLTQGVSLLYNVNMYQEGNRVIAEILGSAGSDVAKINPAVTALLDGRKAALAMTRDSEELILKHLDEIHTYRDADTPLSPFVVLEGGHSKYGSGSNLKLNTYRGLIGLDFNQNNLTLGAFLEAGRGNYSTRNYFDGVAGQIRGDGNSNYFGIGIFGHYKFDNNFYADGALRWGRSKTKFESYNLTSDGSLAHYQSDVNYLAGHLALGYQFKLDAQNKFDFSLRYLGSRLGSDNLTVAGDPIKFDSLKSNRLRLSADWKYKMKENMDFLAGVGYEYEFSGDIEGKAYHKYDINAISVQGSTGIVKAGLRFNPESNRNMSIDFNVQATFGKRKGVDGYLRMMYEL